MNRVGTALGVAELTVDMRKTNNQQNLDRLDQVCAVPLI